MDIEIPRRDRESYRERLYQHYLANCRGVDLQESRSALHSSAPYLKRVIRNHVPPDRNIRILDLGCGFGALLYWLKQAGYRTNLDMSPLEPLSQASPPTETGQFGKLMSRIFEPVDVGFIVFQTRSGGFIMGETMKKIECSLVPRFLWPDKLNMNTGKWVTSYLGFSSREEDATASTALTPAGELYWNFAVSGILGTIVLYLIYGHVWLIAERFGRAAFAGALLLTLSVTSINVGEFSGSVVYAIGIYALLVPVFLWPRIQRSVFLFLSAPGLSTERRAS